MSTIPNTAEVNAAPRKKLAVIGVGSVGLISLMHFCTWLDDRWDIYSIHNPDKKILGIGESTNGEFVGLLERATHFALGHPQDLDALDATIKFGSKFMKWREHSWINPLLDGGTAVHFNNFYLKDFVYERLQKRWPQQFKIIEGDVKQLSNYPEHVTVAVDEQEYTFDYVIDCMGFPGSFEDYVLSDCTPVNHCQIHSITNYDYEPYTDHIAHKNGWMFGVPLKSRKTYGYMYNDTITSKEDAMADMKQILGMDELGDKEYVFKCYYARKLVDGRISKNGNKALFFEPLVANSIFIYTYVVRLIYDYIMGTVNAENTNANFVKAVQEMEDVISYYYQGGSTFESEFWDYASRYTKERMNNRKEFQDVMALYRDLKSHGALYHGPTYGLNPLTWEIIDEQLGYDYIG